MTTTYDHFIGGRPVAPADGGYFDSTNPATLEVLYRAARGTAADAGAAVDAAQRAFESPSWRDMPQPRRARLLRRFAELVAENAEDLARTEALDNGKLLREMRGQLASVPEYLYYYAGLADKIQGDTIPASAVTMLNYTVREPLGVVVAITPWNSPLTLTTSKLAPALAAGNTIVIKPSEHTSASIVKLAQLAHEAGFPDGVVNVVTGFGAEVGGPLVDHDRVAKVSFTGSTQTGSAIAASAGRRFVASTMELGGKSPQLVFGDADLHNASIGVVAGIFAAAGQTCIAGSRVYAHASVYDELVERVVERARSIVIGNPVDDDTELGPLAFEAQRDKVEQYVGAGVDAGAAVAAGGRRPDIDLPGYFYEPTVFTGADASMSIVREEIFGPVASIMRFEGEDEAVRLANDTEYGLAAGIWTTHLSRAHRVARRLDAGTVWVNTYRAMSPMSPRQGFKSSGTGVEHGLESIKDYTRLKSVWVNTDESPAADPFVMRG